MKLLIRGMLFLIIENSRIGPVTEINWELADSYLPFVVEIVNWNHMRPVFQKNIHKDLTLISLKSAKVSFPTNKTNKNW